MKWNTLLGIGAGIGMCITYQLFINLQDTWSTLTWQTYLNYVFSVLFLLMLLIIFVCIFARSIAIYTIHTKEHNITGDNNDLSKLNK